MELRRTTVPLQTTNMLYLQHKKSFIKYVTNYHNIASFDIPEPGPPIKYVRGVYIEGYFLTCHKNKFVSESTFNRVVNALVHMSIHEESDIGSSIMESETGPIIRDFKGYV